MSTSVSPASVAFRNSSTPSSAPEASAAEATASAQEPSTTACAAGEEAPAPAQPGPGQSLTEMSKVPTGNWERTFGTREQQAAFQQTEQARRDLSAQGSSCDSKADCESKAKNLTQISGLYANAREAAAGKADHDGFMKYEVLRQGAAAGAEHAQGRADDVFSSDAEKYQRTGKYPNDNGPFSGDRGTPFGTGEDRIGKPTGPLVDFVTFSPPAMPGIAINMRDDTVYQTHSGPSFTFPQAASGSCPTATAGWVIDARNAAEVNGFMAGNSSQVSASIPAGRLPVNVVVAVTKAQPDGKFGLEVGVTCPSLKPSVTVAPFGTSLPVAAGAQPLAAGTP